MNRYRRIGGLWVPTGIAQVVGPPPPPVGNSRDLLVYGQDDPAADGPGGRVGVPTGTKLTQWGDPSSDTPFNVTANNQIVENLEIWGSVEFGAFSNVLVRNCRVHGTLARTNGKSYFHASNSNFRGAVIIDCDIAGRDVTVPATYLGQTMADAGRVNHSNEWIPLIQGGNYSMYRCEIVRVIDGFSLNSILGNVTAMGNWLHKGWFNEWSQDDASGVNGVNPQRYYPYSPGTTNYTHADAVQFAQGKDYTFVGNRLGGVHYTAAHNVGLRDLINANSDDMYNSAFILKQEVVGDTAKIERVLIDSNWLGGGTATMNIAANNGNTWADTKVTNNRFVRATWSGTSYILRGVDAATGTSLVGTMTGNVFEDDGSPVPISRGATG